MNKKPGAVCVYCGSRPGKKKAYTRMAADIGSGLADRGIDLVYGAGSIGLMGVVAWSAKTAGGAVVGVIPEHLDAVEITFQEADELHITKNMHDRKRMMFERSDAFLILPGGLGSLDEMMEILTWAQLSLHSKPVILVNHEGYWDRVLDLFDHIIEEGFAGENIRKLFGVASDADEALAIIDRMDCTKSESHSELM